MSDGHARAAHDSPEKNGGGTTITVKGRDKLSVACGVMVHVVLLPYAALEEDSTHIPDNIELQIGLSLQRPPGSRQSHADSSIKLARSMD